MLALGATLSLNLSSCGSDSDDESENSNPATKGEWYQIGFVTGNDFKTINEAIANHEKLSYYWGDFYAEVDNFFDDDGKYDTSGAFWGRLWCEPNYWANVWHIVDDKIIEFYIVHELYKLSANAGPKLYIFDAGYLGKLYYPLPDNPTIHTYIEYDGKLILDNGTILIRTGNDIIQSGNSEPCKRFTPMF